MGVEARHAHDVHGLGDELTAADPFGQGWIPGAGADLPGPAACGHVGEDDATHAGVDAATLTYTPRVASMDRITGASDRPPTRCHAVARDDPFVAG